ncbi:MAG: homoserine dehydrogenase [Alphaproteobacteria bacterium]|nr:homoserine dehydrogenase [Alphaproteobacteria bacterium]
MSAAPLDIAVAGLGTVGAGVIKLIEANGALIARRGGRPLRVVAVAARERKKDRGVDLSKVEWYDDASRMAAEAKCDVVVELIGGADGIAHATVEAALKAGKHVVTANKALLAHRGTELARVAEDKGLTIAYEAAVAGGIPIIKAIREGLAGNRVSRVYGILNGTCNYILTRMRKSGEAFADVLADAQKLGYAEADPSFDVDGIDAAHKLAILAGVAFGTRIDFPGVHVEGIRRIGSEDIQFARELGFRIKLLGIAELTEAGLMQRVHPCMVPLETPIAHVEDVYNAVVAEGDFVGRLVCEGRGAGAGPTASAVVADIVDIAHGRRPMTFQLPAAELAAPTRLPIAARKGSYYIRLDVVDRPGVMADVTATLRDENVSLASMLQRGRAPGERVPVVLVTHETEEAGMRRALDRISKLGAVLEEPHVVRIERF